MAFGKNHRDPYATSVGHLIEKATFAGVQTEDWGQFMHICDIINTAHDGPKDAVKALKKRIFKNYNHKEIQLTLSLIDMCMQNCGPSFQSLIVKKEFVKDSLAKLLSPRYTLPLDIQNRILNLIKTWSQGFPGGVDVSEVKEVYLDLLKKGVQFPLSDTEAKSTRQETAQILSNPTTSVPTAPALSSIIAPKNLTITLAPEQIGKLHSELDMVKMNVRVMFAILMENIPGSENREDIELLQVAWSSSETDISYKDHSGLPFEEVFPTLLCKPAERCDAGPPVSKKNNFYILTKAKTKEKFSLIQEKLYKTCREMQERIMDLLVVVENEDLTVELIQVNENLNNAILGYERFVRNQQRILEENKNQNGNIHTTSEPSAPSSDLLDLSPSPPLSSATLGEINAVNSHLSNLNLSSPSHVVTNDLKPSIYPQEDLLALENTEVPLLTKRISENLTLGHMYENCPEHSNSILLQPVNLQDIPAAPLSQRLPPLPSNHPAMTKNDLQAPNYYEVMEFDPLAPAATTETIYEEIDAHHFKGPQSHKEC